MLYPKQRRLQRPPDFTGTRLDTFRQVLLRHGLPGALLAIACLLTPQLQTLLAEGLAPALSDPARYVLASVALFVLLAGYARWLVGGMRLGLLGWIVYLGALSAWEEWVFRLALPHLLAQLDLPVKTAVLLSNALFGIAHYFTLRWKWYWCLGAFLGGLALSSRLEYHGNLWLIIALHWVATTINTPTPPGRSN